MGLSRLSRNEAASVRGYFLLVLALYNGTRSSEHINLEIEWVLNAQVEPTTKNYVIKVSLKSTITSVEKIFLEKFMNVGSILLAKEFEQTT